MSPQWKAGDTFIQVFSLQSNFLASSEPQLETLRRALSFLVPLTCSYLLGFVLV